MATGARQADAIPYRVDGEAVRGQHRDTRQRAGRTVVREDADADKLGPGTAAGEAPAAADAKAVVEGGGLLRWKNAAGKDHVRAAAVDLIEGSERQAAEIKRIHAEAGDPAGGAVGGGDGFHQLAEFRRRYFVAAVAFWHQRAVNANLFKA
ncbi:Uncharacterised protein [Raoultella terrigena]|uniref:Uncharacterized protein n=1 Tax=Raoultella terrigena TaxID=577 RepID=A0A7Z8Z7E8_RAOTE|nr:Uncharacterised protein [Raoultella terrigena]